MCTILLLDIYSVRTPAWIMIALPALQKKIDEKRNGDES